MRERISELMDGELDERAAGEALDTLARDGNARAAWRMYHLIGDAMREARPPTAAGRVIALRRRVPAKRSFALALAASLAAVALVGWLAFAPAPERPAPIAKAPAAPALVPLPIAANDYLLAHQGFSPRMSLQGMAPYVRTVSDYREESPK
jgi:sigma-E factor negative regulatory protein RseA